MSTTSDGAAGLMRLVHEHVNGSYLRGGAAEIAREGVERTTLEGAALWFRVRANELMNEDPDNAATAFVASTFFQVASLLQAAAQEELPRG